MQFLVNMIIRPPRAQYPSDVSENNSIRKYGGKSFVKKVFTINNEKA